MLKGLKTALWGLVPAAILIVLSFVFWDVLIGKLVVPVVVSELEKQRYIRESIKNGRFVAVEDQQEFAHNHSIPSQKLIALKNGEYLRLSDLNDTDALNSLRKTLDELVEVTNTLKRINDTYSRGSFEVTLYTSTVESDPAGYLVLNSPNPEIQYFLRNGEHYYVQVPGGRKKRFTVRLDRLKDTAGKYTLDPIGRLPRKDFDNLFDRVGLGVGTATVLIDQER